MRDDGAGPSLGLRQPPHRQPERAAAVILRRPPVRGVEGAVARLREPPFRRADVVVAVAVVAARSFAAGVQSANNREESAAGVVGEVVATPGLQAIAVAIALGEASVMGSVDDENALHPLKCAIIRRTALTAITAVGAAHVALRHRRREKVAADVNRAFPASRRISYN